MIKFSMLIYTQKGAGHFPLQKTEVLNPLLFYIKVVQMMVKKENQHQKPWWGGEINRPGQVTPHPCTN